MGETFAPLPFRRGALPFSILSRIVVGETAPPHLQGALRRVLSVSSVEGRTVKFTVTTTSEPYRNHNVVLTSEA